jgi:formylglycine-generating enzyme required for sulfatase activity
MGSNPSYFVGDTSRPVEQVSWNDIQPFCTSTGMRLPTEAEWEYAYRAGTTTAFHGWPANPSGTNDDNQLGTIAWFLSNSGNTTRPVAGKAANGFGLYDMSGNVWEWCQDWYGAYASGAQTNPTGPGSGSFRLLRGGYWDYESSYCRASYRNYGTPDDRYFIIGFRVARTP